MNLL
jgi:hypothetical protein